MSYSDEYLNKRIKELTPYKYLDSLDTVRFKDYAYAQVNGAELHAYADFFLSLLMGEGIVVPNNQLIDSVAFLDVASQLIEYAKNTERLHLLNIRASLYKTDNPYKVAANHFGNIGKEEDHKDRFVLSGWPDLDEDFPRRIRWKEKLILNQSIPAGDEDKKREYTLINEISLVKRLNTVLEYFHSPDGKFNVTYADPNQQIRIDEIDQVANLGPREIEDLLKDSDVKTQQILVEIISVINKLKNNIKDIDVRSNIINALKSPNKATELNPFYFENTNHPQEAHRGVLAVIDSIYNYASGVGIRANLIGHTAKASFQDKEMPSFYALALWARLTNKKEKNFVLSAPNGLIVPSGLQWNKMIERQDIMNYIAKNKFPWKIIFDATTKPAWRRSLHSYLEALDKFQASDPSNAKEAREAEKKYEQERLRHLEQAKHRIPGEFLEVRNAEIRIQLADLKKQVDVTVITTTEENRETSSTKRKEAGVTTSAEAKVGAEAGLTSAKVYGEVSGKVEADIRIANEKQEKQLNIVQSQTSIKSNADIAFKIKEVEKLFEIEKANAAAIKGVIAAIEKTSA